MNTSRRHFCLTAAASAFAVSRRNDAQEVEQEPRPLAPAAVAAVERDRVLAAAKDVLDAPAETLAKLPPLPGGLPRGTFFSELPGSSEQLLYTQPAEPELNASAPAALLKSASMRIGALTSAYILTGEERYAASASRLAIAWFVDPATRMLPNLDHARIPARRNAQAAITEGTPEGLLDAQPLAEIAVALPFLEASTSLPKADADRVREWFHDFAAWLDTARIALLARDATNHLGSTWQMLAAAGARLLNDETALTKLSARFRKPILRTQVKASGEFPQEVATAFPYRNTLWNFDLLAASAQLLSTPFDSVWQYELADGPGMRAVSAYLYPLIATPARWPWPADAAEFHQLPARRPALLFAGRAYKRAEYIDLWQRLPDKSAETKLQPTFPVTQPLLWLTRAPHTNRI